VNRKTGLLLTLSTLAFAGVASTSAEAADLSQCQLLTSQTNLSLLEQVAMDPTSPWREIALARLAELCGTVIVTGDVYDPH
jgi:hypothetical protein